MPRAVRKASTCACWACSAPSASRQNHSARLICSAEESRQRLRSVSTGPIKKARGFLGSLSNPRTRIFAASPGAPEELMICTPAALPCRAAAASDVERLLSSDDFTEATEP